MTKLKMLNDLKINLSNMEISFSQVVACKSIKVVIGKDAPIDLVVSCEKDEVGVYLKVHVNDANDLFCNFTSNSDTEFTSAKTLAKKIKFMTKQYAKFDNL